MEHHTLFAAASLIIDRDSFDKKLKEAVERAVVEISGTQQIWRQILAQVYQSGYQAALTDVISFRDSLLKPVSDDPSPA